MADPVTSEDEKNNDSDGNEEDDDSSDADGEDEEQEDQQPLNNDVPRQALCSTRNLPEPEFSSDENSEDDNSLKDSSSDEELDDEEISHKAPISGCKWSPGCCKQMRRKISSALTDDARDLSVFHKPICLSKLAW
ncbi:uncharacterized protein Z518_11386 [Rhinocladiella mackenziei CBS 650.93]|uniref:Uncharacterized protein n=1 Tax=Rhinocladiella mackenziei CBS 650.93 TaxID=1442369 RepID=A0A0D2I0Z8_9EURO|nr:uncharacterized protein Z518_11386 [Rhinocladiella mackenziei CBS 650.93]KIW99398.1 hypothetical protein Z518_11386 [Rhinocladiella mackenziei CBS 650.93]